MKIAGKTRAPAGRPREATDTFGTRVLRELLRMRREEGGALVEDERVTERRRAA